MSDTEIVDYSAGQFRTYGNGFVRVNAVFGHDITGELVVIVQHEVWESLLARAGFNRIQEDQA